MDLALNNLQRLICHKTPKNQPTILVNQTCACAHSPTMFTTLETSTNELRLQLSILEALPIKINNCNCVFKSNPNLHCFLIIFSDHQKKTQLPVPTLLAYSNFFSICFSSFFQDFHLFTIPRLLSLVQNRLSLPILGREVTERKGPDFFRILIRSMILKRS